MAFTNSPLVQYTRLSPNHSGTRTNDIYIISPHCMAGQLTAEECGSVFAPASREASSNYGIGYDGKIGMYVEEKNRSWCTSSSWNDNRAVTIEVASDQYNPCNIRDAAYQSLIKLCADICYRNGKKKLLWLGDLSKSLAYKPASDEMIITVHRWFANKACPGDWLYSRLGEVSRKVTAMLGGGYVSQGTYSSEFSEFQTGVTVDYTAINPYMLELNDSSPKVKWAKMRSQRVMSAMVYAGELYTANHKVKDVFRGKKTYEHVENAIASNVPFGYYMPARARSTVEVSSEMYELSFLVRKYPPKLGVWLQIDGFNKSTKSFNNKLMKKYQEELIRLGLKAKIGIRGKKSVLSRIDWDKFQNDWTFWLDDKVKSISELDTLLTPEFFDTDGKSG